MKIAILARKDLNTLEIILRIHDLLREYELYFEKSIAKLFSFKSIEEADRIDLVIWIGGDGTLLRYSDLIRKFKANVLGIKTGEVGFLCEITPAEIEESLSRLKKEDYKIEERKLMMIDINGEIRYALNDACFIVKEIGKTSRFSVLKDGKMIINGRSDGIIVSTSLGSTAYLASKGGPIIDPSLDLLVLDQFNPLRWGSRPFVFPFNSEIEVRCENDFKAVIDGNFYYSLSAGERAKIRGSEEKIRFVRFKDNFYEKVMKRTILDV